MTSDRIPDEPAMCLDSARENSVTVDKVFFHCIARYYAWYYEDKAEHDGYDYCEVVAEGQKKSDLCNVVATVQDKYPDDNGNLRILTEEGAREYWYHRSRQDVRESEGRMRNASYWPLRKMTEFMVKAGVTTDLAAELTPLG